MNTSRQNRLAQLRAVSRAMRAVLAMLWETERRMAISLFPLQIFQVLVPLAQLWIAKLVIDRLVTALRLPHPLSSSTGILWLVALELAFALVGLASREVVGYQRQVLAERLTGHMSTRILTHAQKLDLEALERSDFYDHLQRLEEGAFHRPASLLFQVLNLAQSAVTLSAAILILFRLQPLALPLLLIAAIPYALVQSSAAVQFFTLSMGQTPVARQAHYFSRLLTTDTDAKEVRAFGLSEHLLARYQSILHQHERQIVGIASRRAVRAGITALLPAAVYAGIFAFLALQALHGRITVGDLTLYLGLVWRSQDILQQMMFGLSSIVEDSLFLDEYQSFLAIQPAGPARVITTRPPVPIQCGVHFDNVSYTYPGAKEPALSDVSLELRVGETVAIVGENGAGKTTLVKLLNRLYDPSCGGITVDGRDVRDFDLESWRQQIAVIFQDFIHYQLTAWENIGFGEVEMLGDEHRIRRAATRGGANSLIEGLPHGYQSVLGRWFDDGVQLSGGEWQHIALARAFMRDAPILVLDEPTAALDARAEYEVFSRFRELTRDRIVLLISHRFSTVRLADRIYVLEKGRVVEAGGHDELVQHRGRYAELFELQAAGYQ